MKIFRYSGKFLMFIGACLIAYSVALAFCGDAEAQEPTATQTTLDELQYRADKVTFCVDLVYSHYLSSTGIELRVVHEKTYVTTDSGAEVFGILGSTDERLVGRIHFKCVYGPWIGERMMLMDFEVVEGE